MNLWSLGGFNETMAICKTFRDGYSVSGAEIVKYSEGRYSMKYSNAMEPIAIFGCAGAPKNDCNVALEISKRNNQPIRFVGYNEKGWVELGLYDDNEEVYRTTAEYLIEHSKRPIFVTVTDDGEIRATIFDSEEEAMPNHTFSHYVFCRSDFYRACELECLPHNESFDICYYEPVEEEEKSNYGFCDEFALGQPCKCASCDLTEWTPWIYNETCGYASKKRFRPPNYQPDLICRYYKRYECCREVEQEYIGACPCVRRTCMNGGTCKDLFSYNTSQCLCVFGYTGENCEKGKGFRSICVAGISHKGRARLHHTINLLHSSK
ncbi:unnamed protein product [Soboliphyme baturini]|uniref:EGF-like domain-containing protein n=1 Tax=Soboliphyme baturini TaxID=241478 RepID=A0A183J852_9BILA|nr:unnamed protein product [Soboliphyme baturini]